MSDNVRVYEIAEEAGASSNEVVAKAKDLGIELKSPQSAVSFEDAEEIANYIMTGKSSRLKKKPAKVKKVVTKKEDSPKESSNEENEPIKATENEQTEVKKVEESDKKDEPKKDKPLKSVAPNKIVPKRRGLKIIKKRKDKEDKKPLPSNNEISVNDNQPTILWL